MGKGESPRFSFYLKHRVYDRIRQAANRKGMTASAFIRQAAVEKADRVLGRRGSCCP